MSNERERVISITLSEAEWQAFIARQPQPVRLAARADPRRGGASPADREQTERGVSAA